MKANINWHRHKLEAIKLMLNNRCDRILVYSGTMPTTANGFTKAANSGSLLATFTTTTTSFTNINGDYSRIYLGTIPTAVNASATGTATWFVCTAAANDTYVFMGEASDVNGTGILMFWSNALTSGQSIGIYSMALTIKQA